MHLKVTCKAESKNFNNKEFKNKNLRVMSYNVDKAYDLD